MATIITITEYPSMPGRYKWSVQVPRKAPVFGDIYGDAESAAATSMELAIRYEHCGYSIFAPANVIEKIPSDMRHVRPNE